MKNRTWLLAAAACAALAAAPARAQDADDPQADPNVAGAVPGANDQATVDPDDQDQGVEEVVVTARKIKETLSDAPVSVSVVTSDSINELGLNSLNDFANQTTGLSFSQAFGRSADRPVIRGQSNVLAQVQAGVETGAALFVDGVYYQGDIQGFDPQSIERVEVIKGPQSALYGRNTYAGAINYITKDPSNAFSISGRFRFAQNKEGELAASLSGPIIPDVLSFRAGGRYFTYGGEYRNQLTGKLVGQEESQSAYLTLLFEPTADIRIRPRAYWQKDDDGPLPIFLQGAADLNCRPGFRSPAFRAVSPAFPNVPATLGTSTNNNQYFCGVIRPQLNNIRLNTDPIFVSPRFGIRDGTAFDGIENEQVQLTNIIDWDLGGSGWVLSSLTGYRDNENLFGTDSDHSDAFAYLTPGPAVPPPTVEPAFANTNRDDQQDFSQEVRLTTPQLGPFRLLLGGFYYKQNFRSVDITFGSGREGLPLGTDLSQYATIENIAAFGSLFWDITDSLEVSAELRYAEEEKTLIDRSTATSIFCAGQSGRAAQFGFTGTCLGRAKFTGTDPRVTVNYTTPGGTLFYGVFATGRKPGGFNGSAGQTATQQTGQGYINYQPEKSTGGEVGIKFDAFGRRLRVSAAAFYNELSSVQLTTAIPNPSGTGAITSIVTNSGDAETKGFELELFAAPTPNLNGRLGISYVDAKFTRGCDADEFILNSGGLRPNFDTQNPPPAALALCDISGRRLPLGSPWQVNGNVSYDQPLGGRLQLSLFGVADASYEASKYVQVHNEAETGDTFLLNGRIGMRNDQFSFALFGRNLTDEDTIPLATRWFDLRYGLGTRGLPAASTVTFDGRPAQIETGFPRGFFATLRRGRQFGLEATFSF